MQHKLKNKLKSKPSFRSTISSSHHTAAKVVKEIEKRTKAEERITKTLNNASSKLKEYLAKKRAADKKKISKESCR